MSHVTLSKVIHRGTCMQKPLYNDTNNVEVMQQAPGFVRAMTDDDMAQLYQDNLLPDLVPFVKQGGLSVEDFKVFIKVGGRAWFCCHAELLARAWPCVHGSVAAE